MSLDDNLSELKKANHRIRLLIDSMGQAILIFGADGICCPEHSAICEDVLECSPANLDIADVLKVPDSERKSFKDWINLVFSDSYEFEEMIKLAPRFFKHSHGKWISLEYRESRNDQGKLTGVILVATDKTIEERAQRELKKQVEYVDRVEQILRHKSQFRNYIRYLRSTLTWLESIPEGQFLQGDSFGQVTRALHNLKGASGSFHLNDLLDIIHQAENILIAYNDSKTESHLREFRFYVSEMGIFVKMFLLEYEFLLGKDFASRGHIAEIHWTDLETVYKQLVKASVPNAVSTLFLKTLMSRKISDCLSFLNSTLQVNAERSGKRCFPILFEGGDIPVMEEQYGDLFNTFVHFASNAARHGIEFPSDRETLGKPMSGQLKIITRLIAEGDQAYLKIQFRDDGQGISTEKIRQKMKAKGRPIPHDWQEEQIVQLVFESDFSTADKVDHFSGRGIGLSAIRDAATKLGGSAWVSSKIGQGTTFTVKVPYLWTIPDTDQDSKKAA